MNPSLPGRRPSILTYQFMEYSSMEIKIFNVKETQSIAGLFIFLKKLYLLQTCYVFRPTSVIFKLIKIFFFYKKLIFFYSVCIYYIKNL